MNNWHFTVIMSPCEHERFGNLLDEGLVAPSWACLKAKLAVSC